MKEITWSGLGYSSLISEVGNHCLMVTCYDIDDYCWSVGESGLKPSIESGESKTLEEAKESAINYYKEHLA